jgi:hypothetical protein
MLMERNMFDDKPHVVVGPDEATCTTVEKYLANRGIAVADDVKAPRPNDLGGRVVATTEDHRLALFVYAEAVLVVPARPDRPATYYQCKPVSDAAKRVLQRKIDEVLGTEEERREIVELLGIEEGLRRKVARMIGREKIPTHVPVWLDLRGPHVAGGATLEVASTAAAFTVSVGRTPVTMQVTRVAQLPPATSPVG